MTLRRATAVRLAVLAVTSLLACSRGEPTDDDPPAAQVLVSPDAASIAPGASLSLTAAVAGADASVTWSVAEAGGGTISDAGMYTAPATPGVYTAIASVASDPSVYGSATITVTADPPTTKVAPVLGSFAASPASVPRGTSSTLSWSVSGAESVSIDNGVGSVAQEGSVAVGPSATTTYTLTATNSAGTIRATAAVTVTDPPATAPGIGACTGLVAHTGAVATSSLARPGYLQPVTEPDFGTVLTRVTGNWGAAIPNPTGHPSLSGATWASRPAGPMYSKDPAWNADQTLLVVKKGASGELFVDGSTYQPQFIRTRGTAVFTEWRWHPTNARYGVYVTGSGEVGLWDPRADAVTVKVSAPGGLSSCTIGSWEGNLSNDGRYVAVQCTQGGAQVFYVVDLGTTAGAAGTKFPTITASALGYSNLDWVSVSPLGGYVVATSGWQSIKSAPLSRSMTGGDFGGEFSSGHVDLGVAPDGTEVAYQSGGAAMFKLATGAKTSLTSIGASQYHGSTRNVAPGARGWGFGTLESPSGSLRGELVAQELKAGGRILRLAHHRTNLTSGGSEPTYEHMAFGAASPDGLRVFFRSDWGNGSGEVNGYVVDVRGLCP